MAEAKVTSPTGQDPFEGGREFRTLSGIPLEE